MSTNATKEQLTVQGLKLGRKKYTVAYDKVPLAKNVEWVLFDATDGELTRGNIKPTDTVLDLSPLAKEKNLPELMILELTASDDKTDGNPVKAKLSITPKGIVNFEVLPTAESQAPAKEEPAASENPTHEETPPEAKGVVLSDLGLAQDLLGIRFEADTASNALIAIKQQNAQGDKLVVNSVFPVNKGPNGILFAKIPVLQEGVTTLFTIIGVDAADNSKPVGDPLSFTFHVIDGKGYEGEAPAAKPSDTKPSTEEPPLPPVPQAKPAPTPAPAAAPAAAPQPEQPVTINKFAVDKGTNELVADIGADSDVILRVYKLEEGGWKFVLGESTFAKKGGLTIPIELFSSVAPQNQTLLARLFPVSKKDKSKMNGDPADLTFHIANGKLEDGEAKPPAPAAAATPGKTPEKPPEDKRVSDTSAWSRATSFLKKKNEPAPAEDHPLPSTKTGTALPGTTTRAAAGTPWFLRLLFLLLIVLVVLLAALYLKPRLQTLTSHVSRPDPFVQINSGDHGQAQSDTRLEVESENVRQVPTVYMDAPKPPVVQTATENNGGQAQVNSQITIGDGNIITSPLIQINQGGSHGGETLTTNVDVSIPSSQGQEPSQTMIREVTPPMVYVGGSEICVPDGYYGRDGAVVVGDWRGTPFIDKYGYDKRLQAKPCPPPRAPVQHGNGGGQFRGGQPGRGISRK